MSVTIPVTDTDLFFSPGFYSNGGGSILSNNIKSGSTQADCNNPGNEIITNFSGGELKLNVDVSPQTGAGFAPTDYPQIAYSIDGGAYTKYQLQSTDTQITLATGLGAGIRRLEVFFIGIRYNLYPRWSNPTAILRVTGLELATGEDISAPTLRPKRAIIYGDSNTEGHEAVAAGVTVANQDARQTYAIKLATDYLNAQAAIVGFAEQGIENAGSVGSLVDNWDFFKAGYSRLDGNGSFLTSYDYILCDHGINDTTDITSSLTTLIGLWRAASSPTTKIFILVPHGGNKASQLAAAVVASGDTNTFLINTGVSVYDTNGSHLSILGHTNYGTGLGTLIQPYVVPRIGWLRA